MKFFVVLLAVMGLLFSVQTTLADWTPAKRLTWNSGWSGYPSLAVDPPGAVHLVWSDDTPGNGEIYYKRGEDGGTSWTPARRLTWSSIYCYYPRIAADYLGHLHVVWQEYWNDPEICYKKSTDSGATWTSKRRLSAVLAGAKHPAIAADAVGNLYVAWIQAGICLTMSTDGGGTWTSPENINSLGANTNFAPAIAAAGSGSAFVVWSNEVDPGNNELFCQTTTNGGATWASARQVTWTAGDSMMPELRYAYGNLFLLWDDDTPGKEEIYFRKSTNGASTWSAAKRLTWNTGVSYSAKTAIPSSGNVHVVWMDNTPGHYEIYHRIGTANGTGWDTARRITWNYCADQAVAVDPNDKLHLVYRVFSAGPGNGELYYKAYQE